MASGGARCAVPGSAIAAAATATPTRLSPGRPGSALASCVDVPAAELVICSYCDTVHRRATPVRRETLHCVTCDSPMCRGNGELGAMLAVTVTAAIAFVVANALPLLTLTSGGHQTRATLWHAIAASYDSEVPFVAITLTLTLLVAPAIELGVLLWLLVPLCLGARPPAFVATMGLLRALRPWRMIEVFFLGVIVAVVKLAALATALPGWGLFGVAVMALALASLSSFDPGALWRRADEVMP
jgi:paraquat-inducible protein A